MLMQTSEYGIVKAVQMLGRYCDRSTLTLLILLNVHSEKWVLKDDRFIIQYKQIDNIILHNNINDVRGKIAETRKGKFTLTPLNS